MCAIATIPLLCGLGFVGSLALWETPTEVPVLARVESSATPGIRRLAVAYVAGDFTAVYQRLTDRCELSQEEFVRGLELSLGCSEEDFGASCSKCAEANRWKEHMLSSMIIVERPSDNGTTLGVVIPEHARAQMAADLDGCASPLEIELWRDRISSVEGLVFESPEGLVRCPSLCAKAWSMVKVYDDLEMTRQSSAKHSCAVGAGSEGTSAEIQLTFRNGFVRRAARWEATVRVWSGDASHVEVVSGFFRPSELEPGDTHTVRMRFQPEHSRAMDRCEVIDWKLNPWSRAVPERYK